LIPKNRIAETSMTIINRALHKAYRHRTAAQPTDALEQSPETVGGWASKVREPKPPSPAPEHPAAIRQTVAKPIPDGGSIATPAAPARHETDVHRPTDGPIVAPASVAVRVDAPHAPAKRPLLVETPAATVRATSSPSVAKDTSRGHPAEFWAWPPIVQKLLNCPAGAEINQLAGRLTQLAAERGLGCLALSGAGRLAGRTSLVLTLAKSLTETCAARVAVVDADFEHPDLARMLSLRPHSGLWDVACERKSGSSPWTTLIPGKLALVPLVARVSLDAVDRRRISVLQTFLRSLRRGYDLVLIDAGPWESLVPSLVFENGVIDAFIGVSRSSDGEELLDDALYNQPGIEWLGTIETFSPVSHSPLSHSPGPQLELQTV
jgi:Mrp family chromosome partitioning ATPase